MKRKNKAAYFHDEIKELIIKGASVRSAWKIINYDLPDYAKISYNAFLTYVKKNIKEYDLRDK